MSGNSLTEYEIADLATSVMSNYLSAYMGFVTILFAYVVAVFAAGARLNRAQVVFVNCSFVVVAGLATTLCAAMLARAIALNLQSPMAELAGSSIGPRAAAALSLLVQSSLILGCLWFMHQVRSSAR